ncbi:MAG: hypothetical protein L3J38_07460 [Thiomicrorhabdus sp.]|nr:hypothetical protein [Thiomicrorhabdus sp.]
MKLFKLTVICGSVLSLAGCVSAPTNPDTTYKPAMSAAYVDLLIEKAKAEERARVMAELAEQNKDDKRFSDIKINQLESKIEQLDRSKASVKQAAPVPVVEPEPVVTTAESTSNDPLLEQWKNIYAQEEQASTPVVEEPKQVEAPKRVEKAEKPVDVAVVEEVEIYTPPPVYNVETEMPVVNQVSAINTFEGKNFDTVLRQCVAGQTIPNPYLGSLPEVLNSNAQPGDSIKLPTLCKWSRSPEVIKELQIALSERGFLKPSPPYDLEVIDGIWGVNTLNSLINYQKSRGLAYGQLSIESLVDLGVIQYSDIVNRKGSNKMLKAEVPPDIGAIEKSKTTPREKAILAPAIIPEPKTISVTPEVKAVVIPKPTPPKPEVKAPEIKAPEIKAPEIKAPEIKAPEIKAPEIKAPEIKT